MSTGASQTEQDAGELLIPLAALVHEVGKVINPLWAVGGCVRDTLLSRPVSDYDFATSLTPDEIEKTVRNAGRHPYLVGKRFGTIGFKLLGDPIALSTAHRIAAVTAAGGMPGPAIGDALEPARDAASQPASRYVEITTLRTESYTSTSRKPQVEFGTTLRTDLSRRDFTINAIAFDGATLIDPFDGQRDLVDKVLRAVGDPLARMDEDPLRILRAARLSAQLGFDIDDELAGAMLVRRVRLDSISRERWCSEMDKLLVAPYVGAGLDVVRDCGALRLIVPELAALATQGDRAVWDGLLAHVAEVPPVAENRWAALLSATGIATGATHRDEVVAISAEVAVRTGLGLRWSKARIATVTRLIRAER